VIASSSEPTYDFLFEVKYLFGGAETFKLLQGKPKLAILVISPRINCI
jgi:hypothetical protein